MGILRTTLLIILISVSIISCKTKELIQEMNPTFMVVESSFTKLVAGEQGEPTQVELTIALNNLPEKIVFDSILFKGNTMDNIRLQIQPNKNHTITVKFDEAKITTSNYKSLNIDFNHALIYYKIDKKKYFYHLKSIEEKGDINMPDEAPEFMEEN